MSKYNRQRFGNFDKNTEGFFTFDSEETRKRQRNRFFGRLKSFFTSYPWWFYYVSYILIFSLSVFGLLLYAFYAPASVNLSVKERSFLTLPVSHYIYPDSLHILNDSTRKIFWQKYIKHQTEALDPNFLTLSDFGPLPKPYEGTPVWQRFRSSYREALEPNRKKLILIISNLGNYRDVTEIMIDLPPEITLEFNPYADFLGQWLLFARAKGHEVLLTVPMANATHKVNYNPGPFGLNFSFPIEKNLDLLRRTMAVTTGYSGLSFYHQPAAANYDQESMKKIFSLINEHGLYIVGKKSYQQEFRSIPKLNYATIDWQLFDYNIATNHLNSLDTMLEDFSKNSKEIFVARIDATPFSGVDLSLWINTNPFQIIPLSYLYARP